MDAPPGTAQDGGLPHVGCDTGNCAAAKADPSRRRLVTSLMLCDPRSGRRWLFDCTPDLREELDRAKGRPAARFREAAPQTSGMTITATIVAPTMISTSGFKVGASQIITRPRSSAAHSSTPNA